MRERRKLAFVGIVVVALVLSNRGELLADPQIALDGVPDETAEARSMDDVVFKAAEGTLRSIPPQRRARSRAGRGAVRRGVRAAVDQAWGKKPIVKVLASDDRQEVRRECLVLSS